MVSCSAAALADAPFADALTAPGMRLLDVRRPGDDNDAEDDGESPREKAEPVLLRLDEEDNDDDAEEAHDALREYPLRLLLLLLILLPIENAVPVDPVEKPRE